ITEQGIAQLELYRTEWENYSSKITMLFSGGESV
ncbi:MAG: PadR family transcriptional regulator, partial [Lachnospiraceae bacterium]